MHRLNLGLYSPPKEFLGNGIRILVYSEGSEKSRTCDAASCRTASPTHYQLSYSSPRILVYDYVCVWLCMFMLVNEREAGRGIIIIINLIYIAQFDTNGILTALYIVITYMYTNAICARMNLHETII